MKTQNLNASTPVLSHQAPAPTTTGAERQADRIAQRAVSLNGQGKLCDCFVASAKGAKPWMEQQAALSGGKMPAWQVGVSLGANLINAAEIRGASTGKNVAPIDVAMGDHGPGDTSIPLNKLLSDARKAGVVTTDSGVYAQYALMKNYQAKAGPDPKTPAQKNAAEVATGLETSIRCEVESLKQYKASQSAPATT